MLPLSLMLSQSWGWNKSYLGLLLGTRVSPGEPKRDQDVQSLFHKKINKTAQYPGIKSQPLPHQE